MDPFVVAHWDRQTSPASSDKNFEDLKLLRIETCRRVLWFSFEGSSKFSALQAKGIPFEVFEGSNAYRFVLEVISGLHSPIFGETEILGQFRAFLKRPQSGTEEDVMRFRPWSLFLLEDAKSVRHNHMCGMGNHSYGSILRKWTRDKGSACLIGTGQLAQEILPWMPPGSFLISREPEEARLRLPNLKIEPPTSLAQLAAGSVIVVASPWLSEDLAAIQRALAHKDFCWIDLRADRQDFLSEKNLDDVFAQQDVQKSQQVEIQGRILNEIRRLALKRWNHVHHRPFGWEDLTS
jgi:glutamyl-tRNA reductase